MLVSDYFDRLWPSFIELKQRVNDDILVAQNELLVLSTKLDSYQKSLTIGDDFVR